jgi:nicotinamidase-related amidase
MKFCIVVDAQKDFLNGVLGSQEAMATIPYIEKQVASSDYDLVIFTKDIHDSFSEHTIENKRVPSHCIRNESGSEIWPSLLESAKNYLIFEKHTFGCYGLPDAIIDEAYGYGEDFEEIHIMGLCTDICVVSNALILRSAFPAVPIYVHANGCAGTTLENHEFALKVMQSCLIDCI